jgi:hypothetical protein
MVDGFGFFNEVGSQKLSSNMIITVGIKGDVPCLEGKANS